VDHPYKVQPDAELLLKDAGDWVAAHKKKTPEKPFFVWIFLIDPHDPYEAPKPFTNIFGATGKETPRRPLREYKTGENLSDAARAGLKIRYDGEIKYMDGEMGKLFGRLRDLGVWENATVAVTADHGEAFGDHNCYLHAWHMWDDVVRVPLLIRSPVLRSGLGGRNDALVSIIDIAPTLTAAAGLRAPATWNGVSLWPALSDPTEVARETVYAEVDAYGVRRAMARDRRHKVVYHHPVVRAKFDVKLGHPSAYPTVVMDRARVELFDVLADPNETRSTRGSTNENSRRLLGLLEAHLSGAMEP
jgi:arylsulfatase A-like enzyme